MEAEILEAIKDVHLAVSCCGAGICCMLLAILLNIKK